MAPFDLHEHEAKYSQQRIRRSQLVNQQVVQLVIGSVVLMRVVRSALSTARGLRRLKSTFLDDSNRIMSLVEFRGDRVEVALASSYELGEGAINVGGDNYLHIDILGRTATRHNVSTGFVQRFDLPTTVGTVVPRKSGGAVVALDAGPAQLDFDTGKITQLTPPLVEPSTNRCNDGKVRVRVARYETCAPRMSTGIVLASVVLSSNALAMQVGPDGRFYFGTMHSPSIPNRPPVGKVCGG